VTKERKSKIIKLQKQVAYEYNNHPIYKYRLNIPSDMVEQLGWHQSGTELEIILRENKIEIVSSQ
jgi:hypothetical protein